MKSIKIFPSIAELNSFAAGKIVEIANESIKERGRFAIALSGGSTPKALFQMLSSDEFKNEIDWSKTFFFFGDERNVLPADDQSNFRMANENLFAPLKIANENIFRWQTELQDAATIAGKYAESLKDFFQIDLPRFDVILLGMGDDGHTASLFPFTAALKETEKNAVENPVEKLNTTRLTFTFPLINNAENVMFLIKGADKAEVLREVLEGESEPEKFPSQSVKPTNGELFWLIDEAAAEFLQSETRTK